MPKMAAFLTGMAVALFIAAPAIGQTITGCRERETGTVYNLFDTALRVRPPLDRVGVAPCKAGDVEFALNLVGPQGASDAALFGIPNAFGFP